MSEERQDLEFANQPLPQVLEPTIPYPSGQHPRQQQIEACSARLNGPKPHPAFRHLDTADDADRAVENIQRVLAAIRWIDHSAAAAVETRLVTINGATTGTLASAIDVFLERIDGLDQLSTETGRLEAVQRLTKEVAFLAPWFEHMAPLRVFSEFERDSLTLVDDLRQNAQTQLAELASDASSVVSEVTRDLAQARRDQTEYAALIEGLTDQKTRIDDMLRKNAGIALQGNYSGVANAAVRSRNSAVGFLVGVGLAGLALLAVTFTYWHRYYGAGTGDAPTGADLAVLFALKVPIVVAWFWLLRMASRHVSAATHRRAVAQAKVAALQTWESLVGTSSSSRELVLPVLADHILDPTKTGIFDNHRDAMSVSPSRIQMGDRSKV